MSGEPPPLPNDLISRKSTKAMLESRLNVMKSRFANYLSTLSNMTEETKKSFALTMDRTTEKIVHDVNSVSRVPLSPSIFSRSSPPPSQPSAEQSSSPSSSSSTSPSPSSHPPPEALLNPRVRKFRRPHGYYVQTGEVGYALVKMKMGTPKMNGQSFNKDLIMPGRDRSRRQLRTILETSESYYAALRDDWGNDRDFEANPKGSFPEDWEIFCRIGKAGGGRQLLGVGAGGPHRPQRSNSGRVKTRGVLSDPLSKVKLILDDTRKLQIIADAVRSCGRSAATRRLVKTIMRHSYWPGLGNTVNEYKLWLHHIPPNFLNKFVAPLGDIDMDEVRPGEHWGTDLTYKSQSPGTGGGANVPEGERYNWLMSHTIELFTRVQFMGALDFKTVECVIKDFKFILPKMQEAFAETVVKSVITDRGGEYGEPFKAYVKSTGLTVKNTRGYRPQTNGCCEASHKQEESVSAEVMQAFPDCTWDQVLPQVESLVNQNIHSVTRFSPFDARNLTSCMWWEQQMGLREDYAKRMSLIYRQKILFRIEMQRERDQIQHWKKNRVIEFHVQDCVCVRPSVRLTKSQREHGMRHRLIKSVIVRKLYEDGFTVLFLENCPMWRIKGGEIAISIIHTDQMTPMRQITAAFREVANEAFHEYESSRVHVIQENAHWFKKGNLLSKNMHLLQTEAVEDSSLLQISWPCGQWILIGKYLRQSFIGRKIIVRVLKVNQDEERVGELMVPMGDPFFVRLFKYEVSLYSSEVENVPEDVAHERVWLTDEPEIITFTLRRQLISLFARNRRTSAMSYDRVVGALQLAFRDEIAARRVDIVRKIDAAIMEMKYLNILDVETIAFSAGEQRVVRLKEQVFSKLQQQVREEEGGEDDEEEVDFDQPLEEVLAASEVDVLLGELKAQEALGMVVDLSQVRDDVKGLFEEYIAAKEKLEEIDKEEERLGFAVAPMVTQMENGELAADFWADEDANGVPTRITEQTLNALLMSDEVQDGVAAATLRAQNYSQEAYAKQQQVAVQLRNDRPELPAEVIPESSTHRAGIKYGSRPIRGHGPRGRGRGQKTRGRGRGRGQKTRGRGRGRGKKTRGRGRGKKKTRGRGRGKKKTRRDEVKPSNPRKRTRSALQKEDGGRDDDERDRDLRRKRRKVSPSLNDDSRDERWSGSALHQARTQNYECCSSRTTDKTTTHGTGIDHFDEDVVRKIQELDITKCNCRKKNCSRMICKDCSSE